MKAGPLAILLFSVSVAIFAWRPFEIEAPRRAAVPKPESSSEPSERPFVTSNVGKEINRTIHASESRPPSAVAGDQRPMPEREDAVAVDGSETSIESSASKKVEADELLVRAWAETNAAAAAAWVTTLPEGPEKAAAMEQVAIAWANYDLDEAGQWISSLPEGECTQRAIRAFAYEADRSDPVFALQMASTLPPTRERDDLFVHSISQWATVDPRGATDWAVSVPEQVLRDRLLGAVATAAAEEAPEAAAKVASGFLTPGEEQGRAAVAVLQRWAQTAPEAAAAWVQTFPESPTRTAAVENLASIWALQDGAAATNWFGISHPAVR